MVKTAALFAPDVAGRHLDLVVTVPDAPITLLTDHGKLRQILINLVGNAVRYTNGQSIELHAECDDGWVVLRVRDHGPGIPDEHLTRIFEPFAQLNNETGRLPSGTGLGLPVSRTLAELLGGTVTVTSRVGAGSTFTVRLPMRSTAPSLTGEAAVSSS